MSAGIVGQLSLYDLLDSPSYASVPSTISLRSEPREPDVDVPLFLLEAEIETPEVEEGSVFPLPDLRVEVTRSRRRKKTAEAQLSDSVLSIRIPAACSKEEERYFVEHFTEKFERSRAAAVVDLEERSSTLASRFGLPKPRSIRWVANQKHQWGSCTPADGSIRLSDRMGDFPRWVIDYVIVHELAHLIEADHGPAFWTLVNAYPKTERARGYLLAKDGV